MHIVINRGEMAARAWGLALNIADHGTLFTIYKGKPVGSRFG